MDSPQDHSNKNYDIEDINPEPINSDNEGDDLKQTGVYSPNEQNDQNNKKNHTNNESDSSDDDNGNGTDSLSQLFQQSSRIMKSVLYSIAYYKLSVLFLNMLSKKYFNHKIMFRWNFYEAYK